MDLPFDYANCVLQRVTRLQHSNKTYASMSEEDMNESMEHPEHGDHNVPAVLSYLFASYVMIYKILTSSPRKMINVSASALCKDVQCFVCDYEWYNY